MFLFLIFLKRGVVFFSVSNFPAHGEGTITSLDKHLVDWRQSPVLYKHMQCVVALIDKVQQRTCGGTVTSLERHVGLAAVTA